MNVSVYRLLLRFYPRRFRDRFGGEMAATWEEQRREQGNPVTRWLRALADALWNGTAERLRAAREDDMDSLWMDLRFSLRSLARRPGLTAVAVATLALGIGATTAIFSMFNAVLLRPLPYQDAERLVMVWNRTPAGTERAISYPQFRDWRSQLRTLSELGVSRGQTINLTGDGDPEPLIGAFVSANLHSVLGASPALGRPFLPEETEPGTARPVALLSHHLWQRRFGGDPAVVGRTLTLNGNPHTVVGVMGPDFVPGRAPNDGWLMATEVWLPAAYFPNAKGFERKSGEFLAIGKLAPGATARQAAAEIDTLVRAENDPDMAGAVVRPMQEQIVGDTREPLLLLIGAVGMLLLIACVNVASLLLARGAQRQKEIAVRAALGAGRGRLIRHLFTESAVLVLVGGAVGLLAASFLAEGLRALVPVGSLVPASMSIDGTVLIFCFAVTAGCAFLTGLFPAWQASRSDLVGVIKSAAGGRPRTRLRDALVVAEGALSVVLLVAAGLLLRSVVALNRVEPGFDAPRVLMAAFRLPAAKYKTPEDIGRFFDQALERLRAIPGAEAAALVRATPFGGNDASDKVQVEGRDVPAGTEPVINTNLVSEGYLRVMGIPLVRGRDFTRDDTLGTPPVAVVSAQLAAKVFPGEDPLGKRIRVTDGTFTVVGVAGDAKHGSLEAPTRLQVYMPTRQVPKIFSEIVVRTSGDPGALGQDVKRAIWAVDPNQPVWAVRKLSDRVERARSGTGALGLLVGLFAGVAVLLASVGIYGVMSYAVVQRRREIGIRVALGAPARRVVWEIARRGAALAAVAAALGCGGAVALSLLLRLTFFGVTPLDPVTFVGATALLLVVASVAAFLPARRAARVDPMVVLAQE